MMPEIEKSILDLKIYNDGKLEKTAFEW